MVAILRRSQYVKLALTSQTRFRTIYIMSYPVTSSWSGMWLHDNVIKSNNSRVTGHLCGEFTGHQYSFYHLRRTANKLTGPNIICIPMRLAH